MNIVALPRPDNTAEARRVLEDAIAQGMRSVIVLGITDSGDMRVDSTQMEGPEAIWLLEFAKHRAMSAAVGAA
jgi:hypothetical protein